MTVRRAKKSPREHAQLVGLRSGKSGKLTTAPSINETFFQVEAYARISSLKQSLDFAKERAHEAMIGAVEESRCKSRLAKSFSASRTSRKPLASSS